MVLALVLVLSAVPTVNVDAASKVKLNKTTVSLKEGKTTTLKVKGTKKKVKWSSSNKKVATVNQKGKVTAKKKGKATITAKVAGKKYKCIVTVKAKKSTSEFPYEINKVYNNGTVAWYFMYEDGGDADWAPYYECSDFNRAHFNVVDDAGYAAFEAACDATGLKADYYLNGGGTPRYLNGRRVIVSFAI